MSDTGFKIWFAFCAVLGVAFIGVIIWAIVQVVTWLTSGGLQ